MSFFVFFHKCKVLMYNHSKILHVVTFHNGALSLYGSDVLSVSKYTHDFNMNLLLLIHVFLE